MKQHRAPVHEFQNLKEQAQDLITATADVAEHKVIEARKRLSRAVAAGKETWENFQAGTLARAKTADEVIRDHPYQSIGAAFAVGALVGFLWRRRA